MRVTDTQADASLDSTADARPDACPDAPTKPPREAQADTRGDTRVDTQPDREIAPPDFGSDAGGWSFEAERGALVSPMAEVSVPAASGAAYIETPTDGAGTASFTFSVDTAGIYKIVARVYSAGAGRDSFYVIIDNNETGEADTWDLNPSADPTAFGVWREDEVTRRGAGTFDNPEFDPYTFELKPGLHSIVFRGRERFTKLDYFYLVNIYN